MTIRITKQVEEVMSVLQFAEEEARAGSHVAVMLSYEAAPAFDSALVAHEPSEFPLAWAAVIEEVGGGGEPPFLTCTNPAGISHSGESGREACPRYVDWSPRVERDEYNRAVARIRELIAAGDTYQVNYSFPLTSVFNGDAYELYRNLCVAQGAPYSAYLDLGRFKVLCLSPELFFERRGNHVVTKPMKGTVKRGRWLEEDREFAQWLTSSVKDRAENVMIVDLLRNDLSRVCRPGTVRVPELFALEHYPTVHHLVSTVVGELEPGADAVDLLRAAFPGGSITGAPKIRAMEIIAELEPTQRGVYCGSIGYLSTTGAMDTSIVIRTYLALRGQVYFQAGGGIVADSDPEQEYRETLDKAAALIEALAEVNGER
jgi:aminodeoxychorismate synthase component I